MKTVIKGQLNKLYIWLLKEEEGCEVPFNTILESDELYNENGEDAEIISEVSQVSQIRHDAILLTEYATMGENIETNPELIEEDMQTISGRKFIKTAFELQDTLSYFEMERFEENDGMNIPNEIESIEFPITSSSYENYAKDIEEEGEGDERE